jgi:hypothetical protein
MTFSPLPDNSTMGSGSIGSVCVDIDTRVAFCRCRVLEMTLMISVVACGIDSMGDVGATGSDESSGGEVFSIGIEDLDRK